MIALTVAGVILWVVFNVIVVAKLYDLQERVEHLEEEL
jgi:hypothetical protein